MKDESLFAFRIQTLSYHHDQVVNPRAIILHPDHPNLVRLHLMTVYLDGENTFERTLSIESHPIKELKMRKRLTTDRKDAESCLFMEKGNLIVGIQQPKKGKENGSNTERKLKIIHINEEKMSE
jgi:hypothetical protein